MNQEAQSSLQERPQYVSDLHIDVHPNPRNPRVLVILHGPLRLFLQAQGALAAIRRQHRNQEIILLTSESFKSLGLICPHVNKVWVDPLPEFYNYKEAIQLYKQFKHLNIEMVYDLMCNNRTNYYFRLIGRKKPKWNGTILWCSHPYMNHDQWNMHLADRYRDQLSVTDIIRTPEPDINWVQGDISEIQLPAPYALIVPGGSSNNSAQRWHAYGYADLANWLWAQHGITSVFLGAMRDSMFVETILSGCTNCTPVNLVNRTQLTQVPSLARRARVAVGNDSGPLHMIAMSRCPTLMLAASNGRTDIEAPRVSNLLILEEYDLNRLEIYPVIQALQQMINLDSDAKNAKQADSQKNQDVSNINNGESATTPRPDHLNPS